MRGIAMNGVHSMKALNLVDAPATIGVLLAKGEVEAESGDTREGWQIYIHSSVKDKPPGGPGAQNRLHPALQDAISKAGLLHDMSSMCARMTLLLSYFYDHPDLVNTPKPLMPLGEYIYMMIYVAGNCPVKEGQEARDDKTGYYLVPCEHSPKKCGERRNHSVKHGCANVLQLIGIKTIGPGGRPDEQDPQALMNKKQENKALLLVGLPLGLKPVMGRQQALMLLLRRVEV